MNQRSAVRIGLLLAAWMAGCASSAHAQANRTFVSVLGADTNPCTHGAPCRTFGRAQSVTATGGEIVAVDSGGYGAVTLTKSVHLSAAPGAYVGVLVSGGDGVVINAPASNFSLQGLTITGTGGVGIRILAINSLVIRNCTFRALMRGLDCVSSTNCRLNVQDCTFTDCTDAAIHLGMESNTGAQVTVEGSRFFGPETSAVRANTGTHNLRVRDCTVIGCEAGIVSFQPTGLTHISDSLFSGNGTTIYSNQATTRVAGSAILSNSFGIWGETGTSMLSFGDNQVAGNFARETFTSIIPQK